MVYVQYFTKSAISSELIQACGDRSVVILDGRQALCVQREQARNFNGFRRPVYLAYQIFKGETFSRSEPLTEITPL